MENVQIVPQGLTQGYPSMLASILDHAGRLVSILRDPQRYLKFAERSPPSIYESASELRLDPENVHMAP